MPPVNASSMRDGEKLQVPKKPTTRSYFILFGKGNYTIRPAAGHRHLVVTEGVASVKDLSRSPGPKTRILEVNTFFRLKRMKKFKIDVSVPARITFSKSGPGGTGPSGSSTEVDLD